MRARSERVAVEEQAAAAEAAAETAEAAAEWLHHKLRGLWGFPDAPGTTMLDRFRANYRGKRFSFGYPACPDLSLQRDLFALLDPGEIGQRRGYYPRDHGREDALVYAKPLI